VILKSYIVEQDVKILNAYQATLIYGVNNGIKKDIREKIKTHNKDYEIINFFENDILKNNLLYEIIYNQSLFEKKKIIFIHEASDKIFNQISECIDKQNNDIRILIFSSNLEKKSKIRGLFEKEKNLAILACYEDNERTLINYVNKELKGFKGLTGEMINMIVDNSSLDREVIKSELRKIKDFFEDKKITKREVLEILNIKNNSGFDKIRDKALLGDKTAINKLLSETEILNDDAFFYLNSLNYRVMRLHEINKISANQNNYEQTLNGLRPPIFWKDKAVILQQLRKWSQKKLKNILIKIAETEILLKKNSTIRKDVVVKNLIMNLTTNAARSF
jgi:DNA polymerase III subunit delta